MLMESGPQKLVSFMVSITYKRMSKTLRIQIHVSFLLLFNTLSYTLMLQGPDLCLLCSNVLGLQAQLGLLSGLSASKDLLVSSGLSSMLM